MTMTDLTHGFMTKIFDASRNSGSAVGELILLLRSGKIDWANKDHVDMIKRQFFAGRVSATLGLNSRESAFEILDLKGVDTKTGGADEKRTLKEEAAYDAAKRAWGNGGTQSAMTKAEG